LFQIISSSSTNFLAIFSHPSYFPAVNSISGDLILLWKRIDNGPLVSDRSLCTGPPIRGRWTPSMPRAPDARRRMPTPTSNTILARTPESSPCHQHRPRRTLSHRAAHGPTPPTFSSLPHVPALSCHTTRTGEASKGSPLPFLFPRCLYHLRPSFNQVATSPSSARTSGSLPSAYSASMTLSFCGFVERERCLSLSAPRKEPQHLFGSSTRLCTAVTGKPPCRVRE
jgi:hypothetical protein